MNPPLRRVVLFGLLGIAFAVVGVVLANRPSSSSLTIESSSEPMVPSPAPSAHEVVDATCANVVTATRPYGSVIVGRQLETLLPSVGQLIVIDPGNGSGPLRLRAERRRGPGTLHFNDVGQPSKRTVLEVHQQRTSPGWPGHWGVETTVTGPGCWYLHVRGSGIRDRLVFAVSRADWRGAWRRHD
jgi:hypothetical protein